MSDVLDRIRGDLAVALAAQARAEGLEPFYRPITDSSATEATIDGRRVIMLGSNNYLGLTTHPTVVAAATAALARYGTSCTGSRVMNGSLDLHDELERRIARFLGKEAALVYSTGYQANLGVVTALLTEDDTAVCDKEVHSSILDAVRMAGASLVRFRHDDPGRLAEALIAARAERPEAGLLVLVDGVYSMSGDVAPLPALLDVAREHGARLLLDDAHGLGVLGAGGRGTADELQCTDRVDIITVTFSKSLASQGGAVAGSAALIEFLRWRSRPLMFSASLTPPSAAAALAALDVLAADPSLPARTLAIANRFREAVRSLGFDCGHSSGPIVPILIGEELETLRVWKQLFEAGVYTNPVLPPGVAPRRCMLRTSFMATHTDEQIERAVGAFAELAAR